MPPEGEILIFTKVTWFLVVWWQAVSFRESSLCGEHLSCWLAWWIWSWLMWKPWIMVIVYLSQLSALVWERLTLVYCWRHLNFCMWCCFITHHGLEFDHCLLMCETSRQSIITCFLYAVKHQTALLPSDIRCYFCSVLIKFCCVVCIENTKEPRMKCRPLLEALNRRDFTSPVVHNHI